MLTVIYSNPDDMMNVLNSLPVSCVYLYITCSITVTSGFNHCISIPEEKFLPLVSSSNILCTAVFP